MKYHKMLLRNGLKWEKVALVDSTAKGLTDWKEEQGLYFLLFIHGKGEGQKKKIQIEITLKCQVIVRIMTLS